MWQEKTKDLLNNLKDPLDIVVIVGSGASVASGLKTFRGEDGHYKGKSPYELASPQGFRSDPELVWNWYKKRMEKVFAAKPNSIHHGLVELEKLGVLDVVITQNVDGLHRRAGQSDTHLIEIHGNIVQTHCFEECGETKRLDHPPDNVPIICNCGSYQRPSVVWFGEGLNVDSLDQIEVSLKNTNLLIIIGTSGRVQPVASFPYKVKMNKGKIIEFNVEPTPYFDIDDIFVNGNAEKTFPKFVEILKNIKIDED